MSTSGSFGQSSGLNPKEKPVPREFGKAGRFT